MEKKICKVISKELIPAHAVPYLIGVIPFLMVNSMYVGSKYKITVGFDGKNKDIFIDKDNWGESVVVGQMISVFYTRPLYKFGKIDIKKISHQLDGYLETIPELTNIREGVSELNEHKILSAISKMIKIDLFSEVNRVSRCIFKDGVLQEVHFKPHNTIMDKEMCFIREEKPDGVRYILWGKWLDPYIYFGSFGVNDKPEDAVNYLRKMLV